MNGLRVVLMILQVIASIVLIASILLQSGKSAGLSGSIAGGSEQLFGKEGRGYEGILKKVTTAGAVMFIVVAIILVAIQ
ncbi:preprotein translocase subunit SecG [Tindallia magadiensis]|uniref:Protein-export membrane protein SecG n=1 Tax=Tindallia magadiensis TaxID=69895 RepID=A0A1I3AR79_9FIRM|nr:preprotein translocase subunit SecG [Tindallia magadiensis]SFH52533.1 preprotein translocase subunit SecG [Tindallia magadiensis]